jgi:hypothetical protein
MSGGIYDRPKKGKAAKVDEFEEPVIGDPQKGNPAKNSFFMSDYSQMHAGSFGPATNGGGTSGIQGPRGCTLESLVSTLATLQFTTKGKVGEDGKFELIFCSPETVVQEVRTTPEEPIKADRVRFVEPSRRRHHGDHGRRRPKGLLWN